MQLSSPSRPISACCVCLTLGLVALGLTGPATAQTRPATFPPTTSPSAPLARRPATVLMLYRKSDGLPLPRKLAAELRTMGLAPNRRAYTPTVLRVSLTANTVVVEVSSDAVHLWVRRPTKGEHTRVRVEATDAALPLAAAEAIRGEILARLGCQGSTCPRIPAARRRSDPPRAHGSPAIRRLTPPAPRRWEISLGAGFLGGGGEHGSSATFRGGLLFSPRPWLRLSMDAFVGLPAVLQRPQGDVALRPLLFRSTAGLALRMGRLRGSANLGVGALVTHLDATASSAMYRSSSSWNAAFAPHLEVGLEVLLHSRLAICLSGLVGVALPSLVIIAGEQELGRWGRPFFGATATLGWRL